MNWGLGLIGLVLIIGLVALLVLGCIVLLAWRLLSGRSIRCDREARAEEARTMQEIHQGLLKMDRRVEALETILLDRARQEHREEAEV